MSTMSLRLPDYLHKSAKHLAKSEHISVNQLVATALAEKISALATEEYLDALAAQGSREAFDQVMSKVKDRLPLPGDEL
ncbi:MAG: toxin-antitoxin system HicB family antitoxin [Desulfuromonadales bacterium]|nr:toxin-antitoxin system HicB family antitoxin [Desulfuromonadales bacterium]